MCECRLSPLRNDLQKLPTSPPRVRLVLLHQVLRALERRPKLRHRHAPKPMSVKVRQPDRHDPHPRALRRRAQRHDGHAGLERYQMPLVVRAALGEDPDDAVVREVLVDGVEN